MKFVNHSAEHPMGEVKYSMWDKCIRQFGLKGSWTWAKRQMMKGEVVRCKHWWGTLKLKIDSSTNTRLLCTFHRDINSAKWETSNHFLLSEDYVDYEIVK